MNKIKELLQNEDNAEKIRDGIAAILKIELENQKKLADDLNIEDKKDYDINVFIENSRPWELASGEKYPFPLVNVSLQETNEDAGKPGPAVGNIKYTGTFYIDCYGCGNYQPITPGKNKTYIPDDSLATKRAWKTARVVRNILMSGFYVYLGLQGVITRRRITKIVTMVPAGLDTSAYTITVCRIYFDVDFFEKSLEGTGVYFEGITFKSDDVGKVNLIDIITDNVKENKQKE